MVRINHPVEFPQRGDCECHEADQALQNARKNKPDNKNKEKKPSVRASAVRKNAKTPWTKCRKCANTPKPRPLYFALARMNPTMIHPALPATGTIPNAL